MKESLWSLLLIMLSVSVLSANVSDEAAIRIDSVSQVQETCDLSNGTLTVHVSGSTTGLEYSIDGGATWQPSNFFGGLPDNDYLVLVRDVLGCSDIFTAQISDALDPEVELMVDCVPGRNLSVIVPTVKNGTPGYQYNWEGPSGTSSQEILENIPPGLYSVTVTDRLGCSIIGTVTVEPCCELNIDCNIPLVEVDCPSDIPALDSILIHQETPEAELVTQLNLLGIDLRPDFCPGLIIGVVETETTPSACADALIIERVYSVSDDFFSYDCRQEIRVLKSTAPIISNEAESIVAECGASLESQFQDWLDNNGHLLLDGCSDPYVYSTEPELPLPPTSCDELVEVTFIVTDACQNELRSTASFIMEDNGAPTIDCPATLELDPSDPLIETKIEDWLETVALTDDCNEITSTHNYSPNSLTIECAQSLVIDVTFDAIDACDNRSTCTASISISGLPAPELNCGDDLIISCNEDRLQSFNEWIEDFSAIDGDGNDLDVRIDLADPTILADLNCNEDLGILFSITDECDRELECLRILTIVDTENPEINCPDDLEVMASDSTATEQIDAWLLDYSASDNCDDDLMVVNNFTLPTDLCDASEALQVTFDVVDLCDNRASCTTQLTVVNDVAELSCPAPLTLECGEATEEIIGQWLDQIEATNTTGLPTNDYPGLGDMIGCSPTMDVTYTAESFCGEAATCTTTLSISDTTPPVLSCPENLEIDLLSGPASGLVNSWLSEAAASDCSEFSLSDDFDLDLDAVICGEEQTVTFTAEDACGLVSTCDSRLILSNEGTIAITCPESIILTCSQGDFDRAIEAHLAQVAVVADNTYDIEIGDIPEVSTECESAFTISVEVSAIDICGNEDFCTVSIDVQPEPEIYLPNIISPDGDGHNDYFNAFGNESIDYVKSMLIYNRWGNKIFEAEDLPINDQFSGWDGQFKQVDESAQVFTYVLEIMDTSGNIIMKTGSIHVIK